MPTRCRSWTRGVAREIRFHAREEAGAVGVEIGGTLYEAIASNGERVRRVQRVQSVR